MAEQVKLSADPYQPHETSEFNPADLENLVRFCVQELQSRRPHGLPPPEPFVGAGIYALYYDGDHPAYQHISIRSTDGIQPIYVGRARRTKSSGVRPLYSRLREHAKSIEAAENLRAEDFVCRFLILHPVWVSTVEDLLIEHFDTLWNSVIKGFGIHDPGGKRHEGELSLWDALHPGRAHSTTMILRGTRTPLTEDISAAVDAFIARRTLTRFPQPISQSEANHLLREAHLEDDES